MLPYHWPHPTWSNQDLRQHPYSQVMRSPMQKRNDKQCCSAQSEQIINLQRKVDHLDTQLKAIWNYFAENNLQQAGGPSNKSQSASPTPFAANQNRKRKVETKPKVRSNADKDSTSVKRKKLIEDLEQKVAEERADNERMELRISEMKKHLAELKNQRLMLEEKKRNRQLENKKNKDAGESEPESADEDDFDDEREQNE